MQRGNAFSTSANAVTVKKPVDDKVQKDASKKDVNEEIADSQMLKNLGKYLLLNDSPDFRFRVALSLGLLVGAKVRRKSIPSNSKSLFGFLQKIHYPYHTGIFPFSFMKRTYLSYSDVN